MGGYTCLLQPAMVDRRALHPVEGATQALHPMWGVTCSTPARGHHPS